MIGLIETALGILALPETSAKVDRLAFGHLDFAADLACSVDSDLVSHARAQLVLHSRAAGLPAPVDGVTPNVRDDAQTRIDTARARDEGFAGKLCLHPDQVTPVHEAFRPSKDETAWARRVLAALKDSALGVVDGEMVDAPVKARAVAVLERSA